MYIQSISFLSALNNSKISTNKLSKNNINSNPINKDSYNITFGARLFRTPENFYAQPFNKNGMPDTMKDYLNADFEDRQKMPPAQMLKLVFDDIKETNNLEQVKRLYPDEALFNNLTDTPKIKSRTGILAEIDLMREEGKTLFKNGNDNLGHYILKKIYTEAKTLKEINSDFKKDVSVYYKGLSPIGYDTLHAFGIKFPDNGFWKSLTATREEFPYEYKPRKPIDTRVITQHHTTQPAYSAPKQRKRFESVKDWEVDKLAKAVIEGHGSETETKKQLKRINLRDEASLNFVAKYMGEINSIVLERLHISPEMHYFFENYDNLNKSQTQKFTEYMKQENVNELRSIIMSDTIKLFFNAYGVDGQNEEFRELLAYARSIKPEREKAQLEHNRIQTEYDEMFAKIPVEETKETQNVSTVDENTEIAKKSFDEILKEESENNNSELYTYTLSDGTNITIATNLKEAFANKVEAELMFYPKKIQQDYIKYVMKKEGSNQKYFLSMIFDRDEIEKNSIAGTGVNTDEKIRIADLYKKEYLMDDDELLEKNIKLMQEYANLHRNKDIPIQQALVDTIAQTKLNSDIMKKILLREYAKTVQNEEDNTSNGEILMNIYSQMKEVFSELDSYSIIAQPSKILNETLKFMVDENTIFEIKDKVQRKYEYYKNPLTKQEINELPEKIAEGLVYYDIKKSALRSKRESGIIQAISISVKEDKQFRQYLTKQLKKMNCFEPYMSDYRAFFDSDESKIILAAKSEYIIIKLLHKLAQNGTSVELIERLTDNSLSYIKHTLPEFYMVLKQYQNLKNNI